MEELLKIVELAYQINTTKRGINVFCHFSKYSLTVSIYKHDKERKSYDANLLGPAEEKERIINELRGLLND